MNGSVIVAWILSHKEIVTLLAAMAAGVGALYKPIRDLVKALPRVIWALIKFTFHLIWLIIWPIRKIIAVLYVKFAQKHVDKLLERISDYLDKKEAAKEQLRDKNSPIKPIEL